MPNGHGTPAEMAAARVGSNVTKLEQLERRILRLEQIVRSASDLPENIVPDLGPLPPLRGKGKGE